MTQAKFEAIVAGSYTNQKIPEPFDVREDARGMVLLCGAIEKRVFRSRANAGGWMVESDPRVSPKWISPSSCP